ncbi:oxidoreductase [Haloprofundus marisrubri]|uniref:Oxidoreductase n=1 Tax=Haloprofundus marisrubri TaxID=1514971 RepID=A0A0W1R6H6_9EURY|nr:Gfo/Idh/MocA family oxidoreductase [Haloprofundus marisrubri]KTG08717.1 oxidoreductase [Haloprofundus marisrubri]
MSAEPVYEVGIVGCGVIGTRLAESFAAHERTNVWGACDLVESKVETFADEYDCASFTDHRALVESDAVDVVYVGVPPVNHLEITRSALEADTHVVCEKPIAENAAEGEKMVELATSTNRTTAINLPFRYTPGFVEMRERVQNGDIGTPKRISLDFRFPQWPREWQDVSWLESREQGGPLREVGTHFLFGVQEIFGSIDRLSADVTYTGPETYEDSIVGYFEADGVHGTLDLLCNHQQSEENSITVVGSESSLTLTEWYKLVENRGEPGDEDGTTLNEMREQTTLTLVDEFVTALDGGDGDLVSFEEAYRVQRAVDAVFASEGTMQDLSAE